MGNRLRFSDQFLEILSHDTLQLMSDEANFHLSGCVNKQNLQYWAEENPKENFMRPLHRERVTVWCGVKQFGIIGPYFFENENGSVVTMNSARYVKMLQNVLPPELQRHGIQPQMI